MSHRPHHQAKASGSELGARSNLFLVDRQGALCTLYRQAVQLCLIVLQSPSLKFREFFFSLSKFGLESAGSLHHYHQFYLVILLAKRRIEVQASRVLYSAISKLGRNWLSRPLCQIHSIEVAGFRRYLEVDRSILYHS